MGFSLTAVYMCGKSCLNSYIGLYGYQDQILKYGLSVVARTLLLLALAVCSVVDGSANEGLYKFLVQPKSTETSLLEQWGVNVDGWLNAGVAINPDHPDNHFNGPVGFSDRSNELQLNQLYLFLERDPEVGGKVSQWSWGGRLDFVFGSDAFYTRSMGDPGNHWDSHLLHQSIYGIAFPQAYLDILAPIGRGLRIKLGEFYTIVGIETVTAPNNFFYSRSYTMQFAEPFSHTGILFNYKFFDRIDIQLGAVTGSPYAGWDGSFQHYLENWGFVGGISFSSIQTGTSIAITGTHGRLSAKNEPDANLYSIVIKQDIGKTWHYTLQHDYGWVDNSEANTSAEWYSVVGFLNVDLAEDLSLGVRLEWFRDDDGARVGFPARHPVQFGHAANYYAGTLGLNWKPQPWVTVRPSIRYDISDGWQAYNSGSSDRQFLVSTDFILNF